MSQLRSIRYLPAEVRALGAFSPEEYEEVYLPWFRAAVAEWRADRRGWQLAIDETGLMRAVAFVGVAATRWGGDEPAPRDRFTENGLKVLLLTCQMPARVASPAYCEVPDALAPYVARVERLWGAVQRLAAGGEAALSDEDVGLFLHEYTRDLRDADAAALAATESHVSRHLRVYDHVLNNPHLYWPRGVEFYLRRGEERLRRHPEVGALYDRLLDEKRKRAHQYLTKAAALQ
jgi:hypothetical protein